MLTDAAGNRLLDGRLADGANSISITALPYGNYTLQLRDSRQELGRQKIVKR